MNLQFNGTAPEVKKALNDSPLTVYKTVLFLSCEGEGDVRQDFAFIGDPDLIQRHLAAMMIRHEYFLGLVKGAVLLAETALGVLGSLDKDDPNHTYNETDDDIERGFFNREAGYES